MPKANATAHIAGNSVKRANPGRARVSHSDFSPEFQNQKTIQVNIAKLAKWSAKECGGSEVTEDMTSPAANQPMMVSPTNLCVARGFFRLGKRSAVYAMTGNRLAQRNRTWAAEGAASQGAALKRGEHAPMP